MFYIWGLGFLVALSRKYREKYVSIFSECRAVRFEIEIEKFIIHRSWRRYLALPMGPHGKVKARCTQTGGRTWGTCLY